MDTLIRQRSGGRRSLDDWARRFFGTPWQPQPDGSVRPRFYTWETLVASLTEVQDAPWAELLRADLDRTDADAVPQAGLARSGWRLAWQAEPSRFELQELGWSGPEGDERPHNLSWSLGLRLLRDGTLERVLWQGPAFQAGLATGMTVLAVNELAYRHERLDAAITANTTGQAPIRLLVKDGERFLNVVLDWRGGPRFPVLERVPNTPNLLGAIYQPRPAAR